MWEKPAKLVICSTILTGLIGLSTVGLVGELGPVVFPFIERLTGLTWLFFLISLCLVLCAPRVKHRSLAPMFAAALTVATVHLFWMPEFRS